MDKIDYKTIELLRYYVSRDLRHIEEKLANDRNELAGYFAASIVDILIVKMFEDYLGSLSPWSRVFAIFSFVFIFFLIYWITNAIKREFDKRWKMAGRGNEKPINITRVVDEFDNIASDGLLICAYYLDRVDEASDMDMKKFYLYEAVHYLTKSCTVFRDIAQNYDYYVSTEDPQLISEYRIMNFLDMAEHLFTNIKNNGVETADQGFSNQLSNIETDITMWKSQVTMRISQ